jgi:hypothetical protein
MTDPNNQNDKTMILQIGYHAPGADSIAPKVCLFTAKGLSQNPRMICCQNSLLEEIAYSPFRLGVTVTGASVPILARMRSITCESVVVVEFSK